MNVVGRLEAGGEEGLRAAVAYYDGFAPLHTKVKEENGELKSEEFEQKMRMVGAELRYVKGGFSSKASMRAGISAWARPAK